MPKLLERLLIGLLLLNIGSLSKAIAGELTTLRTNRLDFAVGGVEWDGPRMAVYLSDQTGRRVVKVSQTSGLESAALKLARTPEALRLSPDGTRLYVATLTRGHDTGWFENQDGFLQILDPDSFTQLDEFKLQVDPYSLAATDDGRVAVGSGSGQWTRLDTYDVHSHSLLGSETGVIYMVHQIALHPSQDWLYFGENGFLFRFDPDPVTRHFRRLPDQFPSAAGGGGGVFVFPEGDRLIDGQAYVYSIANEATNDFRRLRRLEVDGVQEVAFNPENAACFVLDGNRMLHQFHSQTLVQGGVDQLPSETRSIQATRYELLALVASPTEASLLAYRNPARGGSINQAPKATFSTAPLQPTTVQPVRFDAGLSTDDGPPGGLQFRWDWDGDGNWDTVATNRTAATHWFHEAGAYPVTLEVADAFGAVGTFTRTIEVGLASSPGEALSGQPAFKLSFPAAAMWVDPVRGHAYFTDPVGNRLVRVALGTGQPDREWRLEFPADALAATADGNTLYFSELVIPRSSFNFGKQAGYIGILDLTTGEIIREFATNIDPAVLLPVGDDRLLVGGGSAQLTDLQFIDVPSSQVLGSYNVRAHSALLARSADRILVQDGSSFDQLRITAEGELVGEDGANVLETIWGPLALSPDGSTILSGNAYLLNVPAEATLPISLRGRLPAGPGEEFRGPVAFDLAARRAAFRANGKRLYWLETGDWTQLSAFDLSPSARFLGLWSDRIIVAGDGGNGTLIQSLPNPAFGAETNLPPVPRLAVAPGGTFEAVTFDAENTTDDEAPGGELLFRWDWEGDGTYDTAFATNRLVLHRYFVAGAYNPRVQVRDRFGATAVATAALTITTQPDPGTAGTRNTPYRLDFAAVDVAFDPVGRRAYASTGPSGTVVSLDLDTGLELRRWAFPWPAERMSVTPDGRRLYVALPSGPHQYASEPPPGRVAEFDLAAQELVRVIPLQNDPWDLAATDDGLLFVSPGSDQFAPLDAYRLSDRARTGRVTTHFGSVLRLNPEQTAVWVGTTGTSLHQFFPANILRPGGGFALGNAFSSDATGYRTVLPLSGNRLLDSNGRILSGANPAVILSAPATPVAIYEAALVDGGRWLAASTAAGIRYLELATGTWLPWAGTPGGSALIGNAGTNHAVAAILSAETRFQLRSAPATNAAQNLAPTVVWAAGVSTAIAVPGAAELVVQADDPDGQVVSLELWNGATKVGDLPVATGRTSVNFGGAATNDFRVVARDNLGAVAESPVLRVVGSLPPVVTQFTRPAVPAVLPGEGFELAVNAVDPDGQVQRVEYMRTDGAGGRVVGVATNAPWTVAAGGVTADTTVSAVAYDDHGIASAPAFLSLHLIGALGDDFYAPFKIDGAFVVEQRSNVPATMQPWEPFPSGAGRSLWWRWSAPSNGIVAVSTLGSAIDTFLGVYTGSVLSSNPSQRLTVLGTNNDAPGAAPAARVKFRATVGTAYMILVDSVYPEGGEIRLNLGYESVFPSAPPNDLFANRLIITEPAAEYFFDTAGATRETLEPVAASITGGRSIWWEWLAPVNGTALVTTAGSEIDTVLSVATPTGPSPSLASLTFSASSDDVSPEDRSSRLLVNMTAGRRYLFAVDSFDGIGGPVLFSFAFTPATNLARPANDDFAAAFAIPGDSALIQGTTRNATLEPKEPASGPGALSVWWSWTAPRDAQAFLSLEGGSANATVWTGLTVSNLTAVPLRPIGSLSGRVAFIAHAGTTYRFRVVSASAGDFLMNLNASLPPLSFGAIEWIHEPAAAAGIRFTGPAAIQGTLQSSSNLVDWTTVLSRTWIPGELPQPLPPPVESDRLFYRLVADP